jgi:hypothetical protein
MSQSNYPFTLNKVVLNGENVLDTPVALTNTYTNIAHTIITPNQYTTPYWLRNKNYTDWFLVEDRTLIGSPTTPSFYTASFVLSCPSGDITVTRPLKHKWTDRAIGELYRSTHVVNPLSVFMSKKVIFATDSTIEVRVRAHTESNNIGVKLSPDNGKTFIASQTIAHLAANQELIVSFTLDTFPNTTHTLTAFVGTTDDTYNNGATEISYPHMQTQVVNTKASARFIHQDIKIGRTQIGYLMGSGDEVPNALMNLGCDVTILSPEDITLESLHHYQGIVVGIRAYNKIPQINSIAPLLNQYVKEGGFVMVQYNTNRGLKSEELGPYPITFSRKRVTEENAAATILDEAHPIINTPNALSATDFNDWVQERGLYFAGEWDENYTPLISWHDTNEEAAEGALLVTSYGKGHYVFTGISFFRQLPAGVEGAYKLFANLISYGTQTNSNE